MDCLVKTLKTSVNNANLPIYGINIGRMKNMKNIGYSSVVELGSLFSFKLKAKVIDNTSHFTIDNVDYTEINTTDWHTSFTTTDPVAGTVEVDIYESTIWPCSINLDSCWASDRLLSINIVAGPNVSVEGNLSNIRKFKNLLLISVPGSGISGKIEDFCACKNIRYINLSYCVNITGTIEDLADGLKGEYRNGTHLKLVCNTKITYQGVAMTKGATKYIIFADGGYTVSDSAPNA